MLTEKLLRTKVVDRELKHALQKRAMLVEKKINIFRFIAGFTLIGLDFVKFSTRGKLDSEIPIYLAVLTIIIVLLVLYVHKKTTDGKYHPSLKYISSTVDLTILFVYVYFYLSNGT